MQIRFLFSIQDKDKKKKKGKTKATKNKQDKNERKQENKQDQSMMNMAEARMAAASIVANSKTRNKENVTAVKSDVKKEIPKTSLAGSNTPPGKLPPIEQQKKIATSSKEAKPRRKITPQGPPQVSTRSLKEGSKL